MTQTRASDAVLAALTAQSYNVPPSVSAGDNVRAQYVTQGDEFIVVVPGTTDIAGWARDFSTWVRWFPKLGPCHEGFGSGGLALWQKVKADIDAMTPTNPNRGIVYTGHSLGGALAQVLAACHAASGESPCRLVTFGAPRVPFMLNPLFGPLVRDASEHVEYQRAGDPIPDVPSWPMFHHPTKRQIIGTAVKGLDPMANHSIALYASDLAALESAK